MTLQYPIRAEDLGYWYLRLNGFLTIPNFVLHSDTGTNQRTDVDVIGVRFPFRDELNGMSDDIFFEEHASQTLFVLVEVKAGRCAFNESWLRPNDDVIDRVIQSAGPFPRHQVPSLADA